jgi:hypothetical protein
MAACRVYDHVLTAGAPSTTLVMCPSHITHKWAREVLLTVPRARAFLIEDMRNGGDPKKQHGICEVKLSKGKTVYEGKRLTLAEMRRMGRREWRKRYPCPVFFVIGKDKGKLGYFWDHAYLKAKSGPNFGSIVNADSGLAILDSERAEVDAPRLQRQGQSLRDPHVPELRRDAVLRVVAGRPDAHPADGADRVHRTLHARVVRLRDRGRTPSTRRRHCPGQWPWLKDYRIQRQRLTR